MGICGKKNAVQFGSGFELWKIELKEKSGPNFRGSGYKSQQACPAASDYLIGEEAGKELLTKIRKLKL